MVFESENKNTVLLNDKSLTLWRFTKASYLLTYVFFEMIEIVQGHTVGSVFDYSSLVSLLLLARKKITGSNVSQNNGIKYVLIEPASPVCAFESCS